MINHYGTEICEVTDCGVVVENPTHRSYACTIRRTKDPDKVVRLDYVNHMSKLQSKGVTFRQINFEDNRQHGGCHLHAVAKLPDGFNFKQLRIRGWNLRLVEIYDEEGWKKYCEKDELKQALRDNLFKREELNDKLKSYLKHLSDTAT